MGERGGGGEAGRERVGERGWEREAGRGRLGLARSALPGTFLGLTAGWTQGAEPAGHVFVI